MRKFNLIFRGQQIFTPSFGYQTISLIRYVESGNSRATEKRSRIKPIPQPKKFRKYVYYTWCTLSCFSPHKLSDDRLKPELLSKKFCMYGN